MLNFEQLARLYDQHPDPDGELTDRTITALRDLRDYLLAGGGTASLVGELDRILAPWGEATS